MGVAVSVALCGWTFCATYGVVVVVDPGGFN